MRALLVVIHGILTRQTGPSWPDHFDAWIARRDPSLKVLKKEYRAGPFPRWNHWVKNPQLARSLVAEIDLFAGGSSGLQTLPPTWFIAHSNGAVIALQVTQRLIARGCWVGGLILTGAACEPNLNRNGVLRHLRSGGLGAALAYCSDDDHLLPDQPSVSLRQWLWSKLVWPYGGLGRTGWTWEDTMPRRAGSNPAEPHELCPTPFPRVATRWFPGGHSTYFSPGNRETTFELFYRDIQDSFATTPAPHLAHKHSHDSQFLS